MAIIVQLLNGTNLCRDAGFQSEKSLILEPGVRKGFTNELEVTTNQVNTGMCFIEVTRDAVTPNEVFLVPVVVTSVVTIDTSGNGYVIARIDKDKINDGSNNELDGTDIAYVEKVASLPVDDPYIVLATLASGVITDTREWAQLSQYALNNPLYFGEDSQVTDAYQVTIPGVKKYIHGKEYTFEANTTNTGASSLSISGLAAKSIRKNFNIVLDDGDINGGQFITVRYDANNDFFQMVNPTATVVSAAGLNHYTLGTIGDNVSASDITNNNNLLYQNKSDRKWYKVTSDPLTYSNKRLAILTESANANDANKKLLTKGIYQGKTFSATVQPSFSAAGTGSGVSVGSSTTGTDSIVEIAQIDNSSGAEFTVTDVTISARQIGTPSGPLYLYLVLWSWDNSEQVAKPCTYWDNTNFKARGAIIGETSIPQISFSGTFANLLASFGANVKIPAGAIVSLCASKGGAPNISNYYQFQANGLNFRKFDYSTFSWSGSFANTPNYSLTIPATSTIGYGVKAYNGINGSYGITPTNPWAKVIGEILSTTEFFFDPERNLEQADYVSYQLIETAASGFAKIDVGFIPSQIFLTVATWRDNTTDTRYQQKGIMRADRSNDSFGKTKFCPSGNGFSTSTIDDFLANNSLSMNGPANEAKGLRLGIQNTIHIARLENGFYVYNSYPTGSGYISAGVAGFTLAYAMFEFISKAT